MLIGTLCELSWNSTKVKVNIDTTIERSGDMFLSRISLVSIFISWITVAILHEMDPHFIVFKNNYYNEKFSGFFAYLNPFILQLEEKRLSI